LAIEAIEILEGAHARFLHDILRIGIIPRKPAGEVIGRIEMRHDKLFEAARPGIGGHCVSMTVVYNSAPTRRHFNRHTHGLLVCLGKTAFALSALAKIAFVLSLFPRAKEFSRAN